MVSLGEFARNQDVKSVHWGKHCTDYHLVLISILCLAYYERLFNNMYWGKTGVGVPKIGEK